MILKIEEEEDVLRTVTDVTPKKAKKKQPNMLQILDCF